MGQHNTHKGKRMNAELLKRVVCDPRVQARAAALVNALLGLATLLDVISHEEAGALFLLLAALALLVGQVASVLAESETA